MNQVSRTATIRASASQVWAPLLPTICLQPREVGDSVRPMLDARPQKRSFAVGDVRLR